MQRVIHGRTNEDNLTKQLERINKFCDLFLFLILHDDHYFMITFNKMKYKITYYNSMGSTDNPSREYAQIVVRFEFTFVNILFTSSIVILQCEFPLQTDKLKKELVSCSVVEADID